MLLSPPKVSEYETARGTVLGPQQGSFAVALGPGMGVMNLEPGASKSFFLEENTTL